MNNFQKNMKRFGTKNLTESNLITEAAANLENWLKGYFKKKEGDTGEWKIGPNGYLEIYVDGKLAGELLASAPIYIPNELMGDLKKGNYSKPYKKPTKPNYDMDMPPEDMF